MDKKVKTWLSVHYRISEPDIERMLENELATSFLIIWPIFEQKCFDGYMQKTKISGFVERIINHIEILDCESAVQYFHNRYQDKDKLDTLMNSEQVSVVKDIINSKYEDIELRGKIEFLVYIIYRFRNNIFHGNKEIRSWAKYNVEIEFCIDMMIVLLEANNTLE